MVAHTPWCLSPDSTFQTYNMVVNILSINLYKLSKELVNPILYAWTDMISQSWKSLFENIIEFSCMSITVIYKQVMNCEHSKNQHYNMGRLLTSTRVVHRCAKTYIFAIPYVPGNMFEIFIRYWLNICKIWIKSW